MSVESGATLNENDLNIVAEETGCKFVSFDRADVWDELKRAHSGKDSRYKVKKKPALKPGQ